MSTAPDISTQVNDLNELFDTRDEYAAEAKARSERLKQCQQSIKEHQKPLIVYLRQSNKKGFSVNQGMHEIKLKRTVKILNKPSKDEIKDNLKSYANEHELCAEDLIEVAYPTPTDADKEESYTLTRVKKKQKKAVQK